MANQESHPSSEVEVLIPFVISIEKIIENNKKSSEATTHPGLAGKRILHIMDRVPDLVREQNENAYSPTIISIGPLHRGTPRLEPMEAVKVSYMSALFERTRKPVETRDACADAMLKIEEEVRNCFEPTRLLQPNNEENVNWLAQVMLIDGCFIIELLYKNFKNEKDPILGNPFNYHAFQRDLLLVENQIPFFVLEELSNLTMGDRGMVAKCFFPFFGDMMGMGHEIEMMKINSYPNQETPYHIIHLFYIYYTEGASKFGSEVRTGIKYSATELRWAGVQLKAARKKRDLFDIKFTTAFSCTNCSSLFRNGHFEIPAFSISESTESFLRNLIAFELSCPEIDSYFISLASLMDILVDTPEDVKLFEEAGIIRNYLGSREEVAQLFNGICKNATPRYFLFGKQYKEAMDFCKPWRVSTGRLRHYYFGNPWSGISVFAAIILFTLTFVSTLYTILPYYRK